MASALHSREMDVVVVSTHAKTRIVIVPLAEAAVSVVMVVHSDRRVVGEWASA